ncbi:MAG: DUF1573 domain-containing protein [Saprospirales bacterium]|nr:DUF1573 domain-containing protein [Saprospirales bacterium]
MKIKLLIFFTIGLFGLISCQHDPGKDKRVEGVPVDGSISSIIRNPATANEPLDTVNVAKISFEEPEYLFGEVVEGAEVEHFFKFTNTGKVPLLITDARSTCGCTVPSWPKETIQPGQGGEIRVVFNTLNKAEEQHKEVTITANTYPAQTKIAMIGFVRGQE